MQLKLEPSQQPSSVLATKVVVTVSPFAAAPPEDQGFRRNAPVEKALRQYWPLGGRPEVHSGNFRKRRDIVRTAVAQRRHSTW
jgi:hypothetical protein